MTEIPIVKGGFGSALVMGRPLQFEISEVVECPEWWEVRGLTSSRPPRPILMRFPKEKSPEHGSPAETK